MILCSGCNLTQEWARGNLSTKPVDKSDDKIAISKIFLCFLLSSLMCLIFVQLFNPLKTKGIKDTLCQNTENINVFVTLM